MTRPRGYWHNRLWRGRFVQCEFSHIANRLFDMNEEGQIQPPLKFFDDVEGRTDTLIAEICQHGYVSTVPSSDCYSTHYEGATSTGMLDPAEDAIFR